MDKAKRYGISLIFPSAYSASEIQYGHDERPDGGYVLHADYAKLEAVANAQAERLERLEGALGKIRAWECDSLNEKLWCGPLIAVAIEALALSPSTTKGEG